MTTETILIFFVSLLILWVKPGPSQLLKLTAAMDKGFFPAISITLASVLVCSGFFIAAAMGYEALSDIFDFAGVGLQLFGVVYLLFMGIRGLLNYKRVPVQSPDSEQVQTIKKRHAGMVSHFMVGLLVTISNPFWIFYFIGILPSLVPLGVLSTNDFIIGVSLILVSSLMVDGPMIILVSQARKMFANDKVVRAVNLITACSFILIAAFLLYSLFFMQDFKFDVLG